MYWPYLRNRLHETLAILEHAQVNGPSNLVLPIFNLVNFDLVFCNRARSITELGQRICLLTNTGQGNNQAQISTLIHQLNSANPGVSLPGFEICQTTTPLELSNFIASYSNHVCVIVHKIQIMPTELAPILAGLRYLPVHVYLPTTITNGFGLPTTGNVILSDPFAKQTVNGNYPPVSNFDNNCLTFRSSGFHGFGDFAAIGDHFRLGGGQASHVALHLTELRGNTIFCNHFVSTSTPTTAHIHAKYNDAFSRLAAHVRSSNNPALNTAGVADYMNYTSPSGFPGLGLPKRWSLKHHCEMMNQLLISTGTSPFV